jgi:hypothetical protein
MALGSAWQHHGGAVPAGVVLLPREGILQQGFRWEGGGFQQLRLQAHQHGGRQEGLAGFGQIPLVAAPLEGQAAGQLDALAQLVEEAIDDGDHVHVPGIDVTTLGRVLKETDGQPGARFSHARCPAPVVPAKGKLPAAAGTHQSP